MNHHICRPAAEFVSAARTAPSILVIDDDVGTSETFGFALKARGYAVTTAASAAEGIEAVDALAPDLILLDLRLPDSPGTAVIDTIQQHSLQVPFVLISGFLTTQVTVQAMRLGAVDVVEKPVDVDDVIEIVDSALRAVRRPAWTEQPRSAAERWAAYVLRACDSEGDLKTLAEWARFAGVSYSSLRESCRLLGIRPRDARDLARILRALVRSTHGAEDVAALLDARDERTLASLLSRASLRRSSGRAASVADFLESQAFVDRHNRGLVALGRLMRSIICPSLSLIALVL
jgi:FixJ family two-component response regulator